MKINNNNTNIKKTRLSIHHNIIKKNETKQLQTVFLFDKNLII